MFYYYEVYMVIQHCHFDLVNFDGFMGHRLFLHVSIMGDLVDITPQKLLNGFILY